MTRGYLVHALSPLHAGVGQGVGLVDLPIAREATTGHPLVPGSSVKGVLRAEAYARAPDGERGKGSRLWRLFGPDQDHAHDHASALRVSDARILLFPVRSDMGTFAWVTCPVVLHRWLRDAGSAAGFQAHDVPQPTNAQCLVTTKSRLPSGQRVVLDGMPFDAGRCPDSLARALARRVFPNEPWWQQALVDRIAVVDDDLFTWLAEKATDVRAHVRIGERGVVEKGALWYEETLPPETVLCGIVQFADNGQQVTVDEAWALLEEITREPVQLGGGATTGHGLSRVRWVGGGP